MNIYKTSEHIEVRRSVNVGTKGHINHGKPRLNKTAITFWLSYSILVIGFLGWLFS